MIQFGLNRSTASMFAFRLNVYYGEIIIKFKILKIAPTISSTSIARVERERLCIGQIWVEGETPFIR